VTLNICVCVCVCVCVSAELRLHAVLVSAAKIMRCIQWSPVLIIVRACCSLELQFVIKMIDKKSLDFVFIAPKLKINKMVSILVWWNNICSLEFICQIIVHCISFSTFIIFCVYISSCISVINVYTTCMFLVLFCTLCYPSGVTVHAWVSEWVSERADE